MPVHDRILQAAIELCRSRKDWRFRPVEIVRALPHLDAGTVRTHVISRCCVNAPRNHPHKWDYFERVARGVYEVRPSYRRRRGRQRPRAGTTREQRAAYVASSGGTPPADTIHAVVRRSDSWFVAECLEVAVVTQGRSLDELATHLQEAIDLHLEGESPAALGLVASPRLAITYELPARGS
jgi:predicted RNase H-like HicB family nuclease